MKYFSIVFDKETPIFSGGETLKGVLRLSVNERLKINSVKLRIKGKAKVQWTHGEATYRDKEKYIDETLFFMKKDPGKDLFIESENYTFPFQFKLPENLPTSFEHLNGRIRYSIKGTVDIPWAIDKHTEQSFSVLSHVDLNNYSTLDQPYGVSTRKVLCCGPCSSKPISVSFIVLKTGFVPGEHIYFDVEVENRTKREVKKIKVVLMQNLTFQAKKRFHNCTRKVTSMEFRQKIDAKKTEVFKNMKMLIPSISPSTMGCSSLIDVSYELFLNFDATGLSVSSDLNIPIQIGTMPVRKAKMPSNLKFEFEECVFEPNLVEIKQNKQKQIFESNANVFKPKYPFYKDFNSLEDIE
ncbi:arrestin domain-containing 3-like [Brachionus plicatilis]|uniref:Arrestin domain-containing 3-like n=1 Tax=Brachionus plicatilis TaxID=10195 RepID=A0A3M7PGQ3_BRAPC|nr:arrestin domain-containing 3-like [Brachionus plicatilis]